MAYKHQGTPILNAPGEDVTFCGMKVTTCFVFNDPDSPSQGTTSGYMAGGGTQPASDTIDKFNMVSNGNASDVGNLSRTRLGVQSASSSTHGYTMAGEGPSSPPTGHFNYDKFPFASDTNATCIGAIASTPSDVKQGGGSGLQSSECGFAVFPAGSHIQSFPFASDTDTACTGDAFSPAHIAQFFASLNTTTHGYIAGGENTCAIGKFAFAGGSALGNVASLGTDYSPLVSDPHEFGAAGNSSATHGYISGGQAPYGNQNRLSKFSFAAETDSSCIGTISQVRRGVTGVSHTTKGFVIGGEVPGVSDRIDTFPFASDTNATCVASLTQARRLGGGNQV